MAVNPAPFPTSGETPYGDKVQDYIDTGDAAVEAAAVAAAGADATAKVSSHTSASNPHDVYLLRDTITIGTGVDLDTLTEPGLYRRMTSVGNAGYNYPVDTFAGYIEVWNAGSYVRQEATWLSDSGVFGNAKWVRTKGGSNPFTQWYRIDTASRVLWGEGNPNGSISAPVGSTFRNTENGGWNGARVWRKDSGTGSSGWVVESGDTGWRDVLTLLPTNWAVSTAAPFTRIRREGNQISVAFRVSPSSVLVGSSRSAVHLTEVFNIPSGWQPNTYAPWGSAYLTLPGENGMAGILNTFAAMTTLAVRPVSALSGLWAANDGLSFTANWTVSTAWPTTLPGTPI